MERRGAAYELWLEVERYLNQNPLVTKTDLAKRVGVSRPTLNRLRDLARGPDRETVRRIAEVIGIPYEVALRLAGYGHTSTSESRASARRAILEDPVFNGNEQNRRHLLELYDLLAGMTQQTPAAPEEPRRRPPRRQASGEAGLNKEERRQAG